jgi:hypothetical protein
MTLWAYPNGGSKVLLLVVTALRYDRSTIPFQIKKFLDDVYINSINI